MSSRTVFQSGVLLNKAAKGESVDLFLKNVFKKVLFTKKEPCFLKEKLNAKWNEILNIFSNYGTIIQAGITCKKILS